MSTMPTAADRIAAQTRQMQGQQVVCTQCGGNQFYEAQITTYRAGGSGSVEISQESDAQIFPILICLCGFPQLPKPATGRRHGGVYETAHKAFRESAAKSQAFLKALNPTAITNGVLEVAAGKNVEGQVKNVEGQVETLAGRITKLEKDLGEPTNGNKT